MRYWKREWGKTDWELERKYLRGPEDFDPDYEYVTRGEKAIDILGREVVVGDRIAVAMTAGRSAEMAIGKILRITEVKGSAGSRYGHGPLYTLRVEWELRSYTDYVKESSIDARLPKYLKLT